MSMRPQRVEHRARHRTRWLRAVFPAVGFALAPKCMVCGLVYMGLGTLLGLTGPELCGDGITSSEAWSNWLTWGGAALATAAVLILRQRLGAASRKIQHVRAA